MQVVLRDLVLMGLGLSVLTVVFAPFLANVFGIEPGGAAYAQCVEAVRLVGATFFGQAVLAFFFGYYSLMGEKKMALAICACKELICPLGMVFLAVWLMKAPSGLWTGLSLAPVVSALLCALLATVRYGRENMPFLIGREQEKNTYIYDFPATGENAVAISKEAGRVLEANGYPEDVQALTGMIFEDATMLIKEKNAHEKDPVHVECAMILTPEIIRLILRDSGVIFDLTSEDEGWRPTGRSSS